MTACLYSDSLDDALRKNKRIKEDISEQHYCILYRAFKGGDNDISYDVLRKGNGQVELPAAGGYIMTTKVALQGDPRLKYIVEFSKGATLLRHYHSDCDELIINNSRSIFRVDIGSNEEISSIMLNPGSSINILHGTKHQVTNLGDKANLEIYFQRI